MAHAGTAVYPLVTIAAHFEPLTWLYTGMYALGPGLLGAVSCWLIHVFRPPTRPVLVLEEDKGYTF